MRYEMKWGEVETLRVKSRGVVTHRVGGWGGGARSTKTLDGGRVETENGEGRAEGITSDIRSKAPMWHFKWQPV